MEHDQGNTRRAAKAETSRKLLASARNHFFTFGYAAASMNAICRDAGVTRGALYHNYGSKVALFEAVVRQIDAEIGDRILASVPEETVTLDGFVRACLTYLQAAIDPEIQKIMFQDAPAVLGQRLRDLDAEGSIGPLQEALQSLMDDGVFVRAAAAPLARMLNGAMVEAALFIADHADGESALAQASDVLRQLVDGLKRR